MNTNQNREVPIEFIEALINIPVIESDGSEMLEAVMELFIAEDAAERAANLKA